MHSVIILADLHLYPEYDGRVSRSCQCRWTQVDEHRSCVLPSMQPMGQIGCDAPYALVNAAIEAASDAVPSPDLILILGDLVHHSVAARATAEDIFRNVSAKIALAFPNAPACGLAIGNNDV